MRALVLSVAAGLALGCGGKPAVPSYPGGVSPEELFSELADVYPASQMLLKRPPAKLQDLAVARRVGVRAYQAIERGDLVVLWGGPFVPPSATSNSSLAILAYEKDAPAGGGW